MLIEDEVAIARDLLRALNGTGFGAEHAPDGQAACKRDGIEPFDAPILDLNLPGIDGLSMLRGWRGEGLRFPILVLSARGHWGTRVEAIDAGADVYLVKPFVMEGLRATCSRRVISRSTPAPAA